MWKLAGEIFALIVFPLLDRLPGGWWKLLSVTGAFLTYIIFLNMGESAYLGILIGCLLGFIIGLIIDLAFASPK